MKYIQRVGLTDPTSAKPPLHPPSTLILKMYAFSLFLVSSRFYQILSFKVIDSASIECIIFKGDPDNEFSTDVSFDMESGTFTIAD